ncbi:MAG: hypothetical protein Q7S38_01750 [bacterium]|nr:hypothetical protein [bacterium]
MFFGKHQVEKNTSQLDPYKQTIESLLSANPNGKVAVLIEDATNTRYESFLVTHFISQGELPTTAYAEVGFMVENNRQPTRKELIDCKQHFLSRMNPFFLQQLTVLDEIANKYPKRLFVVPEWQNDETIEVSEGREQLRMVELKQQALELAYNGDLSAALPVFKDAVELQTKVSRIRDENIVTMINKDVGNGEQDNIIGLVSFMGAAHANTARILKRSGYNVQTIYAGKEKGKLLFDPFTVAFMHRRFAPNKSPDIATWKKWLVQTVVYEFAAAIASIAGKEGKEFPYSEQEVCSMTWQLTKHLTEADVNALEKDIAKSGFENAVLSLFGVNLANDNSGTSGSE